MELAQILKILWRRKSWVLLILLCAALASIATKLEIGSGGLRPKSYDYGLAHVEFLVDSPRSSLIDVTQNTEELATRAQVYALFMRSNVVRDAIAREARVPAAQIVVEGLYAVPGRSDYLPRPAPARANEVRDEVKRYRLLFVAEPGLPVVSVRALAPTVGEATSLATAAVVGVRTYVDRLMVAESVPREDRTQITQLAPAVGGTVRPGVDKILAPLAFLVVAGFGVIALLCLDGLVRAARERRSRLGAPGVGLAARAGGRSRA